jgi:DMSO/TMAO reductase YedYZ heme-binding membrane subunit
MSNHLAERNGPVVLRIPPYGRALGLTAASYALLHHLGSLPGSLGAASAGTRWVDWVDLPVPYAVLVPAALTLAAARVGGLAVARRAGRDAPGRRRRGVGDRRSGLLW